jgi:hypothetical protein
MSPASQGEGQLLKHPLSYLVVRLVLHREFETASLRRLCCSLSRFSFRQSCCLLLDRQCCPSLQSQAGLRSGPPMSHNVPQHWVTALSRLHCFSTFCCLLNGTVYADLPPVFAWLQWIIPALVILLAQPLHLHIFKLIGFQRRYRLPCN